MFLYMHDDTCIISRTLSWLASELAPPGAAIPNPERAMTAGIPIMTPGRLDTRPWRFQMTWLTLLNTCTHEYKMCIYILYICIYMYIYFGINLYKHMCIHVSQYINIVNHHVIRYFIFYLYIFHLFYVCLNKFIHTSINAYIVVVDYLCKCDILFIF